MPDYKQMIEAYHQGGMKDPVYRKFYNNHIDFYHTPDDKKKYRQEAIENALRSHQGFHTEEATQIGHLLGMKKQAYYNGFIKRASEYGFTEVQADQIFKEAGLMDTVKKTFNSSSWSPWSTQQPVDHSHSPLGAPEGYNPEAIAKSMQPQGMGGPPPTMQSQPMAQNKPQMPTPQPQVTSAPIVPNHIRSIQAPQANDVQPMPPSNGIDFRKYTGTAFDQHSKLDRWRMQQLVNAQQQGRSLTQAANMPYHR